MTRRWRLTERGKLVVTVLCTGGAAWLVSALALMLGGPR